jgi:hypothetical protein
MKNPRPLILMPIFVLLGGLLTGSVVRASQTGDLNAAIHPNQIGLPLVNTRQVEAASGGDRLVVRIYVDSRADLDAIANSLDIWEAHPEGMYIVAEIGQADYQRLTSLGYRLEIDAEKTARVNNPLAVLDPRYSYFDANFPNPNGPAGHQRRPGLRPDQYQASLFSPRRHSRPRSRHT